MNIKYQTYSNPNIYVNYPNKPIQYMTSSLSSPKKIEEFSQFNNGMRHYYSAEINKKINYDNKPVYRLNPHYIANHISTNTNQNIIYPTQINDNIKNINLNIIPTFQNNQISLNQNLVNNNINLMPTSNINNPYVNQTNNRIIITQPIQNSSINNIINEKNILNGFPQQNNFNRITVPNNLYYNINQNNIININQQEPKIQPFIEHDIMKLENNEIPNFNNTMPNLTNNNELYTKWKSEFNSNDFNERKTYQENHKVQELDNYLITEPMRQTEININNILQNRNNISFPKNEIIFQNQIVAQNKKRIYEGLQEEKITYIEINRTKINNNINKSMINNNNNTNIINNLNIINQTQINNIKKVNQIKNMNDIEQVKTMNEENKEKNNINNIKENGNNINNINNMINNDNKDLNARNIENNNNQKNEMHKVENQMNNPEKSNINESNNILNKENNQLDKLNYTRIKSDNININKNMNNNNPLVSANIEITKGIKN